MVNWNFGFPVVGDATMPAKKGAETSKIREGKNKAESNGTNLTAETSLLRKIQDIEKLANSISNKQIRLVETPPIVYISNDEKEKDSKDIEEFMPRIDSLVEGDIIAGQEEYTVEEEVIVREEEVHVEVVHEKAEEENTKTEIAEKESVENIIYAPEFVDATNANLEAAMETEERSKDRAKPKEQKRKCSKDKKHKKEEKKMRKKKHRATTLMVKEN
ncbi:hypothetical protein PVK06_039553 [Gossypium arboreum]|uniref:Uncharacterized protein n=1 Tax=Gossypium arboreum TaxID=29729 RepID=A0ABR0N369_GOSAR|nr:hypothetical protein PVK06_039553 [Gossypium arboreum]